MEICQNKVVMINYTLKDDDGEIIDTSEGGDPLAYIHGMKNIISGLEKALEGKRTGDKLNVSVSPEEGYGEIIEALRADVDRGMFEGANEIEVGMQFHAQTDKGPQVVTVIAVNDSTITIDGNHPLAGQTLNFDVEIMDVRDATAEEIDHGHVHGPGGHHH